jgi:hydrogenase nickel incorporation protein HypA/HybF
MHEASLIVDLMRRIDRIAGEARAKRVTGVSVWLGALSHLSADHFTAHFNAAAAGTIAAGAALHITLSDDANDARAQDILLQSIEVES